jgi:hypothetical protein
MNRVERSRFADLAAVLRRLLALIALMQSSSCANLGQGSAPPESRSSVVPVPAIHIGQVPPQVRTGGALVDIGGEVRSADLPSCRVIVYTRTDQWYIQPDRDGAIDLDSQGHWRGQIHGGSRYAAMLVSQTFQPPLTTDTLPQEDAVHVLAIDEVDGR